MQPSTSYSVILKKYEEALLSGLSEVYPDETDHSRVSNILIPHFRNIVQKVTSEVNKINGNSVDYDSFSVGLESSLPVSPFREIYEDAFVVIDIIREQFQREFFGLHKNRQTEVLLKNEVLAGYRKLLADKYFIFDKRTLLLMRDPKKFLGQFRNEPIPPYENGTEFVSKVLGCRIKKLSLLHIDEMMKVLQFPDFSEETKRRLRLALMQKGIVDKKTLKQLTIKGFAEMQFPPFGSGLSIASVALGERPAGGVNGLDVYDLNIIADELDLPDVYNKDDINETANSLEYYELLFARHGIFNYETLMAKPVNWYRSSDADFSPIGKAGMFFAVILGEPCGSILIPTLEKVAVKMGFKKPDKQEIFQKYRNILSSFGIVDRNTLMSKTTTWYTDTDFPPYGKGRALFALILGQACGDITYSLLHEVADKLEYPDRKTSYLEVLANAGVFSSEELFKKGTRWFRRTGFPPYGKGIRFAREILGKKFPTVNLAVLSEISEYLFV
ncbi:hypothetical protein JW758_01495 [Candidatus Peregrinibacteria bacterium]|nr:hypothetical protein [Candidatus Peregrinibacteria bacterium]